jgi:hypothetical protein
MTFWMVDLVPLKRAYVKENVLFFKKKKRHVKESATNIYELFLVLK